MMPLLLAFSMFCPLYYSYVFAFQVIFQGPSHVNAGTQVMTSPNGSEIVVPVRTSNAMVIKQLRNTVEQTQNMAEMYREQVA